MHKFLAHHHYLTDERWLHCDASTEEELIQALKAAENEPQKDLKVLKQQAPFLALGTHFLENNEPLYAATLFAYVINASDRVTGNPQLKQRAITQLQATEQQLMTQFGLENPIFVTQELNPIKTSIHRLRTALQDNLNRAIHAPQDDDSLLTAIQNIRQFTMGTYRHLWEIAKGKVGLSPELARRVDLIAHGSTAKGFPTEYSDIETSCAVLPSDGAEHKSDEAEELSEQDLETIRKAATLFHFMVICLGETIVPDMAIPGLNQDFDYLNNWFEDYEVTPRGLSLDGQVHYACINPLGRRRSKHFEPIELIRTPRKLAALVEEEGFNPRNGQTHIATALSSAVLLSGEGHAFKEFVRVRDQEVLDAPVQGSYMRVRHKRALDCLERHLDNAQVNLVDPENNGAVIDVKKDLYRVIELILDYICLYFDIEKELREDNVEPTLLNKLEKLIEKRIVKEGGANLRKALLLSTQLRLQTYQANESQRGGLPNVVANPVLEEQLLELFFILIPLQRKVEVFVQRARVEEQKVFSESDAFHDPSKLNEGLALYRLKKKNKGKRLIREAIEGGEVQEQGYFEGLNITDINKKVDRVLTLGLRGVFSRPDPAAKAMDQGIYYYNCGADFIASELYGEARTHIARMEPGYNQNKCWVLLHLNNGTLQDTIWWERGYRYSRSKAEEEYTESLRIARETFGNDPHLYYSDIIFQLAQFAYKNQQYQRSYNLHCEALLMRKRLYGGKHCMVARSLQGIGTALKGLWLSKNPHIRTVEQLTPEDIEALKQAEKALQKSIKMNEELGSPKKDDMAAAHKTLAQVNKCQFRYEEGLRNAERAYELYQEHYGHDHRMYIGEIKNILAFARKAGVVNNERYRELRGELKRLQGFPLA